MLSNKKAMIIRGATGRKMPYGRISQGDILYIINNNAEGIIHAKANVMSVINSDKMSENESAQLINHHQEKHQLTKKQYESWAGKRYLVLIEISNVEKAEPFRIDNSNYRNMDDWLPVEDIEKLKYTSKWERFTTYVKCRPPPAQIVKSLTIQD